MADNESVVDFLHKEKWLGHSSQGMRCDIANNGMQEDFQKVYFVLPGSIGDQRVGTGPNASICFI